MTDAPGDDAYPIAATVFVIMYKQPKGVGRTNSATDFFRWALESGQKQASDLDYVPLLVRPRAGAGIRCASSSFQNSRGPCPETEGL